MSDNQPDPYTTESEDLTTCTDDDSWENVKHLFGDCSICLNCHTGYNTANIGHLTNTQLALYNAIKSSYIARTIQILGTGIDINFNICQSTTLLEYAIHVANIDIIKILINHMDEQIGIGSGPYLLSIRMQKYDVFILLLNNFVEKGDRVHYALMFGNNEVIRMLFESDEYYRQNINTPCSNGKTSLYTAAEHINMFELIPYFIDLGAKVCFDQVKAAARYGNIKAIGLLLQYCAPYNSNDLVELMNVAVERENCDTVGYLVEFYELDIDAKYKGRFLLDIFFSSYRNVKSLIELGADPNIYIEHRTLLQKAIIKNKKKTVRLLIEHGADVDMRNKRSGLTSLEYAKSIGNATMVELIEKYEVPVKGVNVG